MFQEISYRDISINPMTAFDEQWMLLSAGNQNDGYNTMTVSWGHLGCLWSKPTAVCYVRPQRYTKQFIDREEIFSLSYFGPEHRKALALLGTKSGRDGDKIAETGLHLSFSDHTVYFEEAKLVIICRKLYRTPILEEYFLDKSVAEEHYPEKDFHDLYVGEIIKVLQSVI